MAAYMPIRTPTSSPPVNGAGGLVGQPRRCGERTREKVFCCTQRV